MTEARDETTGGLGKWWWASAALMAFVVLGLVFVLLFPRDKEGPATPQATDSGPPTETSTPVEPVSPDPSSSSPSPTEDGWEATGCNGTSGSSKIPTKAPEGVQWTPVGAISVPTSTEYGPLKVDELPLRRCFQHSPTGALFAAVNIAAAGGATGRWQDSVAVTREQMTDGPVRDEGLAERTDGPGEVWSVAGFRVGACDEARCNVDLVLNTGGKFIQWTLSMVWVEDDWKVDGNQKVTANYVNSPPADFAAWAPGM